MTTFALIIVELLRLLLRVAIIILGSRFLRSASQVLNKRDPTPPDSTPEALPLVTVQLPVRNEFYVVEQLIEQVCALDYPRQRLEIQVLDDSDDQTRALLRRLVQQKVSTGVPIQLITREQPLGFKAGALNNGLTHARGSLVAIFDADNLPPADFLRQHVSYFNDDQIGFLQVRWSYINRAQSLLTRLQAIILDGLFAVEQPALAHRGLPLPFNGTSGIWRRRCLEQIGGWHEGQLTEDAEAAARAFLQEWRGIHRREYAVPTEIPAQMASFRAQQQRWARGSAQMLRALASTVLSSSLPRSTRATMLMQAGRHLIYILLLFTCLSAPFTTLYQMPYLIWYSLPGNISLLLFLLVSLLFFYGVALRSIEQPLTQLSLVPFIIPLAIGMSLTYSTSFFKGLVGGKGVFIRTPKYGHHAAPRSGNPAYRARRDPWAVFEVLLGVAEIYFTVLAVHQGHRIYSAFFLTAAVGFLWVGLGSLRTNAVR